MKLSWYGVSQLIWLVTVIGLIAVEGVVVHRTDQYPVLSIFSIVFDSILAPSFYFFAIGVSESWGFRFPRVWRQRIVVDQFLLTLKLLVPLFYFADLIDERTAVAIGGSSIAIVATIVGRIILLNVVFCGDCTADGTIVGNIVRVESDYDRIQWTYQRRNWGSWTGTYANCFDSIAQANSADLVSVRAESSHLMYALITVQLWVFAMISTAAVIAAQNPEIDSSWYGWAAYAVPMMIYTFTACPHDACQRKRQLGRVYRIVEPVIVLGIPMVGMSVTAILTFAVYERSVSWANSIVWVMVGSLVPVIIPTLISLVKCIHYYCFPDHTWSKCGRWWLSTLTSTRDEDTADDEVGKPPRPDV